MRKSEKPDGPGGRAGKSRPAPIDRGGRRTSVDLLARGGDRPSGKRGGGRKGRSRKAVARPVGPNEQRPAVEPFRLLSLGLLLMVLPWVGALPALPPGDGMAGGIAAGLWIVAAAGGVIFGVLWRAWDLVALPVLAGAALFSVFLLQAERESTAARVADVPAGNLPGAEISRFYQVSDGRIMSQLVGLAALDPDSPEAVEARIGDGGTAIAYCVMPLVGPGWRPTQPVPAWAIGVEEIAEADHSLARSSCPRWADDRRILVRPRNNSTYGIALPGFALAIHDALTSHGLRTPGEAPLLLPTKNVRTGLGRKGMMMIGIALAVQAVGLVAMLVLYRRRAARPPTPA